MDTVGILERSLQAMEDQGWIQGRSCSDEGICAGRAIWESLEQPWLEGGRLELVEAVRAIGRETGLMNIALWNDHPDRTFSQVREVFRRAAYAATTMEVAA